MAASAGAAHSAASDSQGPASAGPSLDNPTIQYSMILDHLIGDKKPVKDLNPAVMGGLPVPPKSEEQKMIERGMESCAFKSALACVGGKQRRQHYKYMRLFFTVFWSSKLHCIYGREFVEDAGIFIRGFDWNN